MNQLKLFPGPSVPEKIKSSPANIITTTGFNQQEILKNILFLYNKNSPVHLDATYNKGSIWKKIPAPGIKSDLFPLQGNTFPADSRKMPFKNNSLKSVFFDPPFMADARGAKMAERYTFFENYSQLKDMYKASLVEIHRTLKRWGILIFKCQDQSHDHKNEFLHVFIINRARELGFKMKDLFISINENFIKQWNLIKQEHAKKTHCYFLVFQK